MTTTLRHLGLGLLLAGLTALTLPLNLAANVEAVAGQSFGMDRFPFGWAVIVVGSVVFLAALLSEDPPPGESDRTPPSGRKDRLTRLPD